MQLCCWRTHECRRVFDYKFLDLPIVSVCSSIAPFQDREFVRERQETIRLMPRPPSSARPSNKVTGKTELQWVCDRFGLGTEGTGKESLVKLLSDWATRVAEQVEPAPANRALREVCLGLGIRNAGSSAFLTRSIAAFFEARGATISTISTSSTTPPRKRLKSGLSLQELEAGIVQEQRIPRRVQRYVPIETPEDDFTDCTDTDSSESESSWPWDSDDCEWAIRPDPPAS